jgi:outer membrane protein OmpA-like peptidoglycan-associated protein
MNRNCARAILLPFLFGVAAAACGGQRNPPQSLVDAHAEYIRAKEGIATQLDPTDLYEADVALQRAERAWAAAPDDPTTFDLAVIAQRKALFAESEAAALKAQQDTWQANRDLEAFKATQFRAAQGQLDRTQQALGRTQMQLQQQQATAAEQQKKVRELEGKLSEARDTIAKIASVKDDDRGMVITLQGEVLFKTGKWELKPAAMAKLEQIAEALKGKEQRIVVYGFTDSVGTRDDNMDLSRRRATSVREYLVSKGISQDLVTAQAKGPDEPVADNGSLEGRAQNRRVEIVVQPKR